MATKTRTATPTPHIWLDEAGRAWIDDTNVKVIEVVLERLAPERLTADQIYESHEQRLSLAQIHSAFAYYYDHQADFDAEIERQDRMVEEMRAQSLINDPIRAKLPGHGENPLSVPLYMDVHVQGAITRGLLRRSVSVLRAQDDGMGTASDPILLDRALALGHIVFTQDADFLVEAARRQRAGEAFAGVVFARQRVVSVRRCIDDLELLAKVYDPPDMMNLVVYLPL